MGKRIVLINRMLIFWGILSLGLPYFTPNTVYAEALPSSPGWYEIPNTKLRAVCPPNNFGGSGYYFQDGCAGVTGAWNSAAFDISQNRILLFGGGHYDYYGNEVKLDAAAGYLRLASPSHNSYIELGKSATQYTTSDSHKVTIANSVEETYGNSSKTTIGHR